MYWLLQPFRRAQSNYRLTEFIRSLGLDPFNKAHLLSMSAVCHVVGGSMPTVKVRAMYVPDRMYDAILAGLPEDLPILDIQ